jgi:hypothetical protein
MKIPDGLEVDGDPKPERDPKALCSPLLEGALRHQVGASYMGSETQFRLIYHGFYTH